MPPIPPVPTTPRPVPPARRGARGLATLALLAGLLAAACAPTSAWAADKVLRYAFRIAETGFDPAQISDLYSRNIASNIFDAPLQFAFMARPVQVRPNTAAALPTVSDDFTSYTFRLKPGLFFADDPAFGGRPRELVAADYVYAWKRHYDPRWKSPNLYLLEGAQLIGLDALRKRALAGAPFDYDTPVEGLRALDRYTFEVRLAQPHPRFALLAADGSWLGAVAREVVERYGDAIMAHPVGTGAYRLAEWRRASRIVLTKNPRYRTELYDETPPADDGRAVAAAARFKGRSLPMIDRVEISIVAENQPRWLSFLNDEHDLLEELPSEYAPLAMPGGDLAPHLVKRGMALHRYPRADVSLTYFNMEDPVVGGYDPPQVALRRAMSLAVDLDKEIALVRSGQAIPAQGAVAPGTWGYDPSLRSVMSRFDRAEAKALLDLHGHVDRDGDGWREHASGARLEVELASQSDQQTRQLTEQWQKNLAAIGIRLRAKTAQWPENLKSATAGRLQMWNVGWSAAVPDGEPFLALADGRSKGQANKSRFDLPAYNELFARQKRLPDGPERRAAMLEAQKLMIAYMPMKLHVHRVYADLIQPRVVGYHRNIFVREFWKYIDIDPAAPGPAL
jgi:ABC-type transport system substrate-binding protein